MTCGSCQSSGQSGRRIQDIPEIKEAEASAVTLVMEQKTHPNGRASLGPVNLISLQDWLTPNLPALLSLTIRSLPTSDPGDGLSMWNNAGVPTLASGVPAPPATITQEQFNQMGHRFIEELPADPPVSGGAYDVNGSGIVAIARHQQEGRN